MSFVVGATKGELEQYEREGKKLWMDNKSKLITFYWAVEPRGPADEVWATPESFMGRMDRNHPSYRVVKVELFHPMAGYRARE